MDNKQSDKRLANFQEIKFAALHTENRWRKSAVLCMSWNLLKET